jgi:hypothetical protein
MGRHWKSGFVEERNWIGRNRQILEIRICGRKVQDRKEWADIGNQDVWKKGTG